jgi:hypothetical protein
MIAHHIKAIVSLRSSIIQYLVHLLSHSSHISIVFSPPSTIDDLHACMHAGLSTIIARSFVTPVRPSIISAAVSHIITSSSPFAQNLIASSHVLLIASQGRCLSP